ncbi:MAG TPA: IS30 family transposase [Candidatus Stackebrandtia excrementipullorum]|nr:IS30 family transposase [Candidatus Stackebrandtia excrementipullorum]
MDFEIRQLRAPQGRKKLEREREAYFLLMAQGVSSREACRIVGINRRTGKRWRNGSPAGKRPARPPHWVGVARAFSPSSGRFLSLSDRLVIADLLREGKSLRAIAAELGRSVSTISREVARNRHPTNGQYRPHAAQLRADGRRPRPKPAKIASHAPLRDFVQEHLDLRWSPEQISVMLAARYPGQAEMNVSTETIYQAIYVQARGGLRRELATALRTGRARRKPRRQAQQRQPRYSHPMVMISERPPEVADRAVPGHWEGDLIIGKDQQSAIGTLVERASRFLMLVHLPGDRSAATFRDALVQIMTTLPAQLRRSVTWDQGSEMGRHHEFTLATDIPVYFCDPASPWQRGSNENTNGLLRQYFPKGTDLRRYDRAHLDAVAHQLNTRPRKTLGWATPAQRLTQLLTV